KLKTKMKPKGDQPQAIEKLTFGLEQGKKHQVLLGVTGSGKTFTVANVIENIQKPTLVIAPNKTLAAQLTQEFRTFFPDNVVEYFVSYYDYYQPEAYLPTTDTYIEKEADINKEIERLRLAATAALMTREDVIIVASVSCIYGLGSPESYQQAGLMLEKGKIPLSSFDGRNEALPRSYNTRNPVMPRSYSTALKENKNNRKELIERFIDMHFTRSEVLSRGKFRWHGNILEIMPAEREIVYRIEFSGNMIDKILEFDAITRNLRQKLDKVYLYPARHFVVPEPMMEEALKNIEKELEERLKEFEKEGKLLEYERLERRTKFDLAMMREIGYSAGIENYSRHLTGRAAGEPPYTLIDYFPSDYLLVIDESHVTVPQLNGMFGGDYSRKKNLIDNGFRLPSAFDNRPLKFPEFEAKVNQVIYTSATPGDYERRMVSGARDDEVKYGSFRVENPTPTLSSKGRERVPPPLRRGCSGIVEQIIRPTGLVDPEVIVKPIKGQVDDLIERIRDRLEKGERVLITTLTKKMAEDFTEYLNEQILCSKDAAHGKIPPAPPLKKGGETTPCLRLPAQAGRQAFPPTPLLKTGGVKKIAEYLHSEVNTVERVKLLEGLRRGDFAVLVGVNLLREGLDLPEVSLVAILDADKEGFLRSETSLIQTIGRAARNVRGQVIFYADNITGSMKRALEETDRRRKTQMGYNKKHNITPATIIKEIKSIIDHELKPEVSDEYEKLEALEFKDIPDLIKRKEKEMKKLSSNLEFEKAAVLRDEIAQLRRIRF
ncbi:MAG: excinuclease ABC subunit UvrB, partial [bacterium]